MWNTVNTACHNPIHLWFFRANRTLVDDGDETANSLTTKAHFSGRFTLINIHSVEEFTNMATVSQWKYFLSCTCFSEYNQVEDDRGEIPGFSLS